MNATDPHQITPHFHLAEFLTKVPSGTVLPTGIEANIRQLATTILEPLRVAMGTAVHVNDGWRLEAHNAAVGGVPTSDHLSARAADIYVAKSAERSWQDRTIDAFDWIRENLGGRFGQLILEDRRAHSGDPGDLCIHVSIPTAKHPGTAADPSRILVSYMPKQYRLWVDGRDA